MRFKIRTVIAEMFKGFKKVAFDFGDSDIVYVTGRNGSGKTSLADAVTWVLTDKDYSLKSNPEVHADYLDTSEPSVTVTGDLNEKEVTLRKFQKDKRSSKQREAGMPISISNQYEINGVPYSQTDFYEFLEDNGMKMALYTLLSHMEEFRLQKSADCRKILFGMTSSVTDKEIAESLGNCEEAASLLDRYSADEITKMKKHAKKEAEENLVAIPNQIIGLEKARVTINVDEFTNQKNTLQAEIDQMRKALEDINIPSIGDLNQQLVMLDQEERQLVASKNADRVETLTQMNIEIGRLEQEERSTRDLYERKSVMASEAVVKKNKLEEEYRSLAEEFQTAKESEYNVGSGKCPYCKQDLPLKAIDDAKKKFDAEKSDKMLSINMRAKEVKAAIKKLEEDLKLFDQDGKELLAKVRSKHEELEILQKKREPFEYVIDATKTPEAAEITRKKMEIKHQIAKSDSLKEEAREIEGNIRVREHTIREIDNRLAELRVNDRIDAQIAELKDKQKQSVDAKASSEKILYQLSLISMEKNKRLTDDVNSRFNIVRFKLFDQQKNGEYKDCCIPMVKADDGSYKRFGDSANTALEIRGKLDIISGLQKFYDMYLPVFVDGYEALDENSRKLIHMDTQLITLSVSNDDLKVELA